MTTMTDYLQDILEMAAHNVTANLRTDRASYALLDWKKFEDCSLQPHSLDLVIGSDVVYDNWHGHAVHTPSNCVKIWVLSALAGLICAVVVVLLGRFLEWKLICPN
eukprot:NODE_824_length_1427_cov_69.454282_g683_i0.p3 GENE.NODE_824_length_1427_cov_69.454282_g683_i0~~NODE_824_length_1427_cov_69.454282_g683_i0.p3  ORF type:complete len:106 (-),score=7.06 NODE_824_length_1427_cov_69.454282_g683_i0:441-758(-)